MRKRLGLAAVTPDPPRPLDSCHLSGRVHALCVVADGLADPPPQQHDQRKHYMHWPFAHTFGPVASTTLQVKGGRSVSPTMNIGPDRYLRWVGVVRTNLSQVGSDDDSQNLTIFNGGGYRAVA